MSIQEEETKGSQLRNRLESAGFYVPREVDGGADDGNSDVIGIKHRAGTGPTILVFRCLNVEENTLYVGESSDYLSDIRERVFPKASLRPEREDNKRGASGDCFFAYWLDSPIAYYAPYSVNKIEPDGDHKPLYELILKYR